MIPSDASPSARFREATTPVLSASDRSATVLESSPTYDEQLDPIFTPQFAEHVALREQTGLIVE